MTITIYCRFEFEDEMLKEIEKMVRTEFANKDISKIISNIQEIFQYKYRHLLTVFDLDG